MNGQALLRMNGPLQGLTIHDIESSSSVLSIVCIYLVFMLKL